jgi:type I restriction enzyme M protein
MLTGEIRSQIDQIWNAFWSGGISNPLEVIEQITYLLFLKRLDEQETAEELKANQTKKPMEKRFFPEGKDSKKRSYQDYRWKRFKDFEARDMFNVVDQHVFPWLRTLGGNGSTYSKHMEGARFTIPTPALLAKVVDMIDKVPMKDRDTKGDLYEYMLGKIASAGQNGQFRTPRHIIRSPRGLQGAAADALLAFLRFWIAVLARTGQEGVPLPWLICSRAPHIEILISLAAM